MPDDCDSCNQPDVLRRDPWHHLSCRQHLRNELTHRHDAVLNVLYHYVRAAGGVAVKEPWRLCRDSMIRPDLQLWFPSRHIITDVVVSHPLAPSHQRLGAREDAATAEDASARKIVKYKQVSKAHHALFIPFSLESTGGMSKDACDLLKHIALASHDHLLLDPAHTRAGALQSAVAIAVQRGNALCILGGIGRAMTAHGWVEGAE